MKIFLSVSYTSQVDSSGNVLPAYRGELEKVIALFENQHHEVYCAPREDGWTLNSASPKDAYEVDMKHVADCDLFIAFIGIQPSAGIQMEIGYALAHGSRNIIALAQADVLGYVNQGMIDAGKAELIRYDDRQDLLRKLASIQLSA